MIIWAYSLAKKTKQNKTKTKTKQNKNDGFLLFLKAFSWETDLWVTLDDFTVMNTKLGTEICI